MNTTAGQKSEMRSRRLIVLMPLILFIGLTAIFLVRLKAGDPSLIPSALIGHSVPQASLPPTNDLRRDFFRFLDSF
jgi:cytochrome c biogenesis protein CcmG, thiol:disulfide interchange protein DsbE